MSNPQLLLLRIEGLMQSWGERSRWDGRDTASFPSKSGIIGLLACALGKPRTDKIILELDRTLKMGVRADRPGVVMPDYQTISGEIVTANGQTRGKKGEDSTIISVRQYLFDASFLIVLDGQGDVLEMLAEALQKPVWPIYLGRKTCVPTRPVYESLTSDYESIEEALRCWPISDLADEANGFLCEIDHLNGSYIRYDRPMLTPSRHYNYRRINRFAVSVKMQEVIS